MPGWFPDPWNPGQLRFNDGRQWTGHIQPVPSSSGFPVEGTFRFPLEQPVLVLLPSPRRADVDVACTVQDAHGRELASITPRGKRPSALGRDTEDLDFVVVASNGAQRLRISRLGGFVQRHRVVVRGPSGQELGRLQQTSGFLRQFRTPRLSMTLESAGRPLGYTDVCLEPEQTRFSEVEAPIVGAGGAPLATVWRTWHYVDTISDFFEYRLSCPRPQPWPVPDLLLATVFSHYLYDRLSAGGPLSTYNRFGRGGTWHDSTNRW